MNKTAEEILNINAQAWKEKGILVVTHSDAIRAMKAYAEQWRDKGFRDARETDFDEDSNREEYIYTDLGEYKTNNPLK